MENKICCRCKKERPLDEFNNSSINKSGKRSHCKECRRDFLYKKRYGITVKDYNDMRDKQNDKCGICGKEEYTGRGKYWHIDHCHDTGEVRGLLCNHCNTSLSMIEGWLPKNIEKLREYHPKFAKFKRDDL